jgi:hypothetical protein
VPRRGRAYEDFDFLLTKYAVLVTFHKAAASKRPSASNSALHDEQTPLLQGGTIE